ncbi:unnamed protein product [Sphenostylis stenocarpa]|uniref:Uncharacterized protein n=1 Tax=Sphenostylis stenocarpa TaxID=92480 RepID=A0AA86SPG0_9FABA|nr:unnamed protein product [Sphenostylis stenocarpa]
MSFCLGNLFDIASVSQVPAYERVFLVILLSLSREMALAVCFTYRNSPPYRRIILYTPAEANPLLLKEPS